MAPEYSIRLHYEAELKRRELASELNSDEVELARAQSSTRIQDLSDLLVNPKFIDEDAETLEDGEEIKTIAGKSLEDTAKQAQVGPLLSSFSRSDSRINQVFPEDKQRSHHAFGQRVQQHEFNPRQRDHKYPNKQQGRQCRC